jgi:hypothetical protein
MAAPVSESISNRASGRRTELIGLGSSVPVAEGEMVPAVLTLRMGRWVELTVPLGAFVVREGKPGFVPSLDVVGFAAVALGIGVGGLGVWKISPIFAALAEKIRSA